MKKKKKKKGSTLVSVLAITVVLLTIGSAILVSAISTTKSNANHNEDKDLQYAAESGIEIARSYFTTSAGTDGKIDTINDLNDKALVKELKKGIVGEVQITSAYAKKVDGTEDTSKIIVKSEAFHKKGSGVSKAIQINLKRNGGNTSIFDHGLIAGQGDITIENKGTNNVNSTISAGGKINPKELTVDPGNDKNEDNPFEIIKFTNEIKAKKIKIKDLITGYPFEGHYRLFEEVNGELKKAEVLEIEMEDFKTNKIKVVSKQEEYKKIDNIIVLKGKNLPSVIQVKVINPTNSAIPLKLLFINAEEVEFEMSQPLDLNNIMIITNSSIKLKGNTSLKLNNSTMLGKDIYASFETAFFINEESGNKNPNGNVDDEENGIFYRNRERVMEIIECFVQGISGNSSDSKPEFVPIEETPYS